MTGTSLLSVPFKLLNALERAGLDDGADEASKVAEEVFYYVSDVDMTLPDEELTEIVKEANPDFFD